MQLYLKAGFSLPVQASFFISAGDRAGVGYVFCQGLLLVHLSLSRKNVVDMILNMNCYPKNGQLSDPDFTYHNLQHPILGCSIKQQYNSIVVLRTRLIRVQLQHPIKQVALTVHSKTSFVRNSDIVKQNAKPLQGKSKFEIHRPVSDSGSSKAGQSQLPQSGSCYP